MSENSTSDSIVEEDGEFPFDEEHYDIVAHHKVMYYIRLCYLPFLIVIGVSCSLLVLTILIGRRLWIRHEAYIYLATILILNIYGLTFYYGDLWLYVIDRMVSRLSITSNIVCKFWIWLAVMRDFCGWLVVLLLLNVYLRQQPITSSDRRGCWTNLAVKYCSLFGTKVSISSYFIVAAFSTFWVFSISELQNHGLTWYCSISHTYMYDQQRVYLLESTWWFALEIPFVAEAVLLLLIVWKRKKSSNIVFNPMNGSSVDNGDAEALTRLFVCCATAAFITGVPGFLNHILMTSRLSHQISRNSRKKLVDALHMMHIARLLFVPIVCLVVKSRFRDDLKTMVGRCCCKCCPGLRLHTNLSRSSDNNFSSVLQLYPVGEDSTVTRREENNDQIHIQM